MILIPTTRSAALTTAIITIVVFIATTTITPVLSDDSREEAGTKETTTATTTASSGGHADAQVYDRGNGHWPLYMYQVADEEVLESYEEFMFGCYYQNIGTDTKSKDSADNYEDTTTRPGKTRVIELCDEYENDRLIRNEYQPSTIIENFTETGFMKIPLPPPQTSHQTTTYNAGLAIDKLRDFFRRNKQFSVWDEHWNVGSVFANVWTKPTMLLDIGRKEYHLLCSKCQTLSTDDKLSIVSSIQRVAESSLNTRLVTTGVHGIRCYQSGHIIQPTVNRLPHVITAIINIGQALIGDSYNDDGGGWPLEVLSHDRTYHNLTQSENGREMILIEGSSIIHGRPYPLGGENGYYCELMVHFEPLGYSARHELYYKQLKEQQYKRLKRPVPSTTFDSAKHAFEKALSAQDSEKSSDPSSLSVPEYIWPSLESSYRQQTTVFESEEGIYPKPTKVIFGQISSHTAASLGDLSTLKELAKADRNELFKADSNGWRPIHEAARSGHADVLEYLIDEGAEINERTNHGRGGNPLFWAEKEPVKNAKAIAVLKKHGAVNLPPMIR